MSEAEDMQGQAAEAKPWMPPVVGTSVTEVDAPRLPTAEEIEAIQEAAREEGRAEGYAEGLDRGLTDGRNQAAGERARLNGILTQLADPLAHVDDAMIQTMGTLVTQIARHLVRRELKTAPDEIVGVIREALKALPPGNELVPSVRVNPEDAELINHILVSADETRPWRLEADPLVGRGGAIVETSQSYIDATLETRINALAAQMFGGMRSEDDGASADGATGP